jgi:TonB family protein
LELLKITPDEELEREDVRPSAQLGLWDPPRNGASTPVVSEDINLLLELEPEAERWRFRAIFVICILSYFVVAGLLTVVSGAIRRHAQLLALEEEKPPEETFLLLPPDLLKPKERPRTNTLSDQNRIARGRAPIVTPQAPPQAYSKGKSPLPEIAGGGKPAAQPPAPPQPPAPKPSTGGGSPPAPAPQQKDDALKLEDVPKPASSPTHLAMASPQEMIDGAAQAAAQGRTRTQGMGSGDSPGQFNNPYSNFSIPGAQILSDTQGVDFGPYLARIIYMVRQNWYAVIPESARLGQKGRVMLDFDIQKDGSVPGVDLAASSGAEPLDRAAEAAINASVPFPPLPSEFHGNHLKLRFIFLYNLGYGAQ